jgi:hypothetical protein
LFIFDRPHDHFTRAGVGAEGGLVSGYSKKVMRMNTCKIAGLVVATVLALAPRAGAQPGILAGGISLDRPEPVKGAPYSGEAITEISQAAAGKKTTLRTTTRIYRDGEGRERREATLDPATGRAADPQSTPTVYIFDPVAGASYMLNVLQHSAIRMPIPGSAAIRPSGGGLGIQPTIQFSPTPGSSGAGAQVPQVAIQQGNHIEVTGPAGLSPGPPPLPGRASSARVERLEPTMIEGLRAEGTRTTETIRASAASTDAPIEIVTETWTSPELKVPLMNKRSDPRGGEVTYRLTHISRDEPDAKLFDVPSDYAIQEMPSISGGMVTGGVTIGPPPR